jgi:hypothetical protein
MTKPRIFLGSSGKQAKLLQAITRGLEGRAIETEGRRGPLEGCGGSSRSPCGARKKRRR